MAAIKEMKNLNKIEQHELDTVFKIVSESFLIKEHYKNVSIIDKKEELIDNFSSFLQKYLELRFLTSSGDKLKLINFLDKLNMQRELLELEKGRTNISDIKAAAQRLGRKSQSAFQSK